MTSLLEEIAALEVLRDQLLHSAIRHEALREELSILCSRVSRLIQLLKASGLSAQSSNQERQ